MSYDEIVSIQNILEAWKEFRVGKKNKFDMLDFESNLMFNINLLHTELKSKSYKHGDYKFFKISDPKERDIHKASVRDRVLHHAIYRVLYPNFDKMFIADSYSCRNNKGTHKAVKRFEDYTRKVSENYTCKCYVLKCDVKKFFASIDHSTLLWVLESKIEDKNILDLLINTIQSFNSGSEDKGLPLGNLTSQLLVNIYMNEFDQYVKHNLKIKYYLRYADDFVFMSKDKVELENILKNINIFLKEKLRLNLPLNNIP